MSLQLDNRRIAMLEQMGVTVPGLRRAVAAGASTAEPMPKAADAGGPAPSPAASRSPSTAPAPAPAAPASPAPASPTPPRAREPAARTVELRPRPAGVEQMDWDSLRQAVSQCQACALCATRRNTVFGVGDPRAHWMIIGEAPGENEDMQGEPFVGQAGKLLDSMLRALGVSRRPGEAGDTDAGATDAGASGAARGAYIANVLKCRPPANRNPEPGEMVQCEPYLKRQIALVQPRIILAMGRFAVQALLQSNEPIGRLRGREHRYEGVPLVVTYHPAYLLRNLPDKAKAWADLCLAMSLMRRTDARDGTGDAGGTDPAALSGSSRHPAEP